MTDLTLRLLNKADMIEMGEKIHWGSDSEIMREAAARIAALEAALKDIDDDLKYASQADVIDIELIRIKARAAMEGKDD